jgi:hypothetical protein
MSTRRAASGPYLIASDFDQTLSFNDSGIVLSELIGASNFREKVRGLSDIHLVQQGAELAYLLRHDPEFRCVRREHLIEAGKQVRLKKDIKRFVECLNAGVEGYQFSFYVISAAPRAVVQSALEGIVPADHIYGAECEYDPSSGEICAIASSNLAEEPRDAGLEFLPQIKMKRRLVRDMVLHHPSQERAERCVTRIPSRIEQPADRH